MRCALHSEVQNDCQKEDHEPLDGFAVGVRSWLDIMLRVLSVSNYLLVKLSSSRSILNIRPLLNYIQRESQQLRETNYGPTTYVHCLVREMYKSSNVEMKL